LIDADSGEVHVYAHPSKPVVNLQQHKEKDKVHVQGLVKGLYLMNNLEINQMSHTVCYHHFCIYHLFS